MARHAPDLLRQWQRDYMFIERLCVGYFPHTEHQLDLAVELTTCIIESLLVRELSNENLSIVFDPMGPFQVLLDELQRFRLALLP